MNNLSLRGSESNQTFPRGAAPTESLINQGTSCGQILQTNPEDFPMFFDFRIQTVKIMRLRVALRLTLNIIRFYQGEVQQR